MNYQLIVETINLLNQKVKEIKASGDILFGAIDSSKAGGNARGNTSVQYRLRQKGEKAKYIKQEDLQNAIKAINRGKEIRALQKEILRLEKSKHNIEQFAIENQIKLAPKPNILGERNATCEWYTPPEYIEMARLVMGTIDLDPASNSLAQSWIKAAKFYTKEDDGLAMPWSGHVWCNPPYGTTEVRLMTKLFMEKAIACYQAGEIESAIFLVNRTGASWYKTAIKNFDARCEVFKRISFLDSRGIKQGSPRYYNDFLYLGNQGDKFKKVFESTGEIISQW